MVYLKLYGRIATISASLLHGKDIKNIDKYREHLFIEPPLFTVTGLLADDTFGYKMEFVEIERPLLGETFLKLVSLKKANVFFIYPKNYALKDSECIVYKIEEFRGKLYVEVPNLFPEDIDVRDLYIGEMILDDQIEEGGLFSSFYYIPIRDALDITGKTDETEARMEIASILKHSSENSSELNYYQLQVECVDSGYAYCVAKNRNGEVVYNKLVDVSVDG